MFAYSDFEHTMLWFKTLFISRYNPVLNHCACLCPMVREELFIVMLTNIFAFCRHPDFFTRIAPGPEPVEAFIKHYFYCILILPFHRLAVIPLCIE
jgi:hypothetical protein